MKRKTVERICNTWNLLEDDDISTPMLLEMIRSEVGLEYVSDVVEGLVLGGILK